MTAKSGRHSAAGILADILDRPVETIPADASIFNFPAWDSLAHVRLMLALEDVTGRPADPSKITALVSLDAVNVYLDGLVAGDGA